MTALEVHAVATPYRAAVAELAGRARLGDEDAAIRVVEGTGAWWERLKGAVGFVVDEPEPAPAGAHIALRARGIPIVIVRRRLRPDVVADAAYAAGAPGAAIVLSRHVVVDAWGGRTDAAALLRDAIGWARVLAGDPLEVVARTDTPTATTIALRGPAGIGASVTRAVGGGVGGALTALTLGSRRVEVRVDSASPLAEVAVDDETGRYVCPPRRESPERLAVRRLLDAVEAGALPNDLAEVEVDDRAATPEG